MIRRMKTNQISPSLARLSRIIPGSQKGGLEAGVFVTMNKIKLNAEHETHIYINGNNGVTIRQFTNDINDPEVFVSFDSKKRAMEVAKILRALAMSATFEPIPDDD